MENTLKRIVNWKGCEKEYWEGITILKENNNLSKDEQKTAEHGLTPASRQIVESKIFDLKKEAEKVVKKEKSNQKSRKTKVRAKK